MNVLDALDLCTFFDPLSKTEKESLKTEFTINAANKGKFIITANSESDSLSFLISGKVKVCTSDKSGKEAIVALLGPGECIGELSLITGDKRSADVIAISDCQLLEIPKSKFMAHAKKHAGLSILLLERLAKRLQNATKRITDLALYDVSHRLTRILTEIGKALPDTADGMYVVNDRPTHQELASMVGATREVVTRALKHLEDEGYILVETDRVIIYSLPSY